MSYYMGKSVDASSFEAYNKSVMKRTFLATAWLIFIAAAAFAQIPSGDGYTTPNRPAINPMNGEPMNVKIANLSEDARSNQKDIQELSLRVEQLERDKATMEAK